MYHTFQTTATAVETPEPEGGKKGSRRISTTNACIECRRRKIRCDGLNPCSQCEWYQHPQLCAYSKPTQRVVPSKKALDRLQGQVNQHNIILRRMFPGQDLETLATLPREELVNLAVTLPATTTSPSSSIGRTPAVGHTLDTSKSEDAESLEALEQAPERDPEMDEARRHKDKINAISDDVNGLSLSTDTRSSYVGISSISAALKVIFKIAPSARAYIVNSYTDTVPPSRSTTPPPHVRDQDPLYLPPPDVGQKLIESYFNNVHVLMPMIDEDHFWHTYLYGERRDPPWLALLNMVMALGALAGSTCDNEEHFAYYQRARKHLDLDTFGSGNLLFLQALGLLSGYYLHWLNRPNEANSLMAATLRMATALGLHREYGDGPPSRPATGQARVIGLEVPAEIRRRTWWSLFCLDTWGLAGTGRPSLGRVGPGMTVQTPKIPQQMNNAQYIASLRLLPIIHNIDFCKLATRIQDTLAARPLRKFEDLFALDAELVQWHDELPPILRADYDQEPQPRGSSISKTPPASAVSRRDPFNFAQPPDRDRTACPEILLTPRAIMLWRYQNLRMLMHRPFLLAAALRRTPYEVMSAEEKVAISKCRSIAGQCIANINNTCREELIAGWNAVWLMHQAVMVPLVSLFAFIVTPTLATGGESPNGGVSVSMPSPGGHKDIDAWRAQIETALRFFEKMRHYSVAARKSKDVVERLYAASRNLEQQQQQNSQQHTAHPLTTHPHMLSQISGLQTPLTYNGNANGDAAAASYAPMWSLSPNADAAMNSFWDDMMWETFPENQDWMQGFEQFDWGVGDGTTTNVTAPNGDPVAGQDWQQWLPPDDGG